MKNKIIMRKKKQGNWRLERLKKAVGQPTSYDAAKEKADNKPTEPDEEFERI
jgi:hypothetical protein